jgi:hypothetical protein
MGVYVCKERKDERDVCMKRHGFYGGKSEKEIRF